MISFLITLIVFWGHVLGFWEPSVAYSNMAIASLAELSLEVIALTAWDSFKS